MVTMVAVGVLLIAAGPSMAIWFVMLQRRAHLLVVAILAAFTWCLAMMFSGTVWLAIPPLKQEFGWVLFVAVSVQELLRFALFCVFRFMARRGDGVEAFLRAGPKNEVLSGLSVGVGFALMSVLIQFYSVVADEFADDTAIYTKECRLNFFVAAGAFSLAYSLLHIFLGILVWPAYSDENRWLKIVAGYLLHLGVSELSLYNRKEHGCVWNLGVTWALITIASCGIALFSRRRIRKESE